MRDQSRTHATAVRGFCLLVLLSAGHAWAQFASGDLYGTAATTRGDELAGVLLTLSGVGAELSATSDEKGQFRFLGLAPGTYRIEAEFGDYAPLLYESLAILIGRTTSVQLMMSKVPSEILVVSAEPPLLDIQNGSLGITVTRTELDIVPTSRDPWSLVDQAPGVLTAGTNVGGVNSGLQPAFVGPGARQQENAFAIDGTVITDMAAIGYSPTYFDFDQFDTVEVTIGGPDASVANSGVTINMQTRTGSNDARASARVLWLDRGLQSSSQLDPEEVPAGQGEFLLRRFASLRELGVEGGGPLVRDRLWGWGSYNTTDVLNRSTIDTPDRTRLQTFSAKLNGRFGLDSSFVASIVSNDKIRNGIGAGPNRGAETFWRQSGPFNLFKTEATHVFSSTFYLSALASVVDLGFGLAPAGGSSADPLLDANGVWRGGFLDLEFERRDDLAEVKGAWLIDGDESTHELSFGFSQRQFDAATRESWGARQLIHFAAENADTELDRVEALRVGNSRVIQDYTAAWLQDSWKLRRGTVALGFRYDLQRGHTPALVVEQNPVFPELLPTLQLPGRGPDFEWRSLLPRVGISYRLGEREQSILRASYSRFGSQLHAGIVERESPHYQARALFEFEDRNGNHLFDASEPVELLTTSGLDPNDPSSAVSPNSTDSHLEPEFTDEILFSVERELQPALVAGLELSARRVSNVLESRPFVRDTAGQVRLALRGDYFQEQVVSGVTPAGDEFSVPVYGLTPDLETTGGRLLTNGDREQEYRGATVKLTKRLSNGWMMRGQATVSDWVWKIGPEFQAFDDPTDIVASAGPEAGLDAADSDGDVAAQQTNPHGDGEGFFLNSSWSFNVTGAYQVAPDKPWGFLVAGQVSGRDGFPLPYYVAVTAAGGKTRQVQISPRTDSLRYDDLYLFDARIEKELSRGSLSTTFSLDAFNLLNSSTVLQRARQLNGPQALFVKDTVSPRVLRLGVRFTWQ